MKVAAPGQPRRVRIVQVSFHLDVERRDGESLLRAWPMLPAVATAVARAEVDVAVVQRAHRQETIECAGVSYHFVDEPRRRPTRVVECVTALKPDVVHVQGLTFPRAVRLLASAVPDVPLLVQDHGTVPPAGWRASAWRWAYRSLAGVAFTASEQATPWKRSKILRADLPVFEVLEGSTDFTPGDREAARAATNMFGEPCLLWTSRLDVNKDPLTMLAAVDQAARTLPGLRLWAWSSTRRAAARASSGPVTRTRASPTSTAVAVRAAARILADSASRREATGCPATTSGSGPTSTIPRSAAGSGRSLGKDAAGGESRGGATTAGAVP